MTATPFVVIVAIWLLLTVPAMIGQTSARRFGWSLFVAASGVMLPLFVFFFSAFLVPDWKGACRHGWLDCFHLGKLALAPLVLWATGALYAVEVCQIDPPFKRAIGLGLFTGVLIAGGCFLYGLFFLGGEVKAMLLWLLVPLYIAVWDATLLVKIMPHSKLDPFAFVVTFLGSIPFWVGGVIWSRRVFESLPEKPPSCFVVTAASRGHRRFVGPFVITHRHGDPRSANRQLITFWQLEQLWRERAPQKHATFRRGYNAVGPIIARQIRSSWLADVTYLALKPAELTARLLIQLVAPGPSGANSKPRSVS